MIIARSPCTKIPRPNFECSNAGKDGGLLGDDEEVALLYEEAGLIMPTETEDLPEAKTVSAV
jgi:hypothetical protein